MCRRTIVILASWIGGVRLPIDGHVCWSSNHQLLLIVCRPRKTKFRFPFLFAANKRKFVISVFCLQKNTEVAVFCQFHFPFVTFRKHGDGETWRHGNMETCRRGDIKAWKHGNMQTWRRGHRDMVMEPWGHQTENGSPRRFLLICLRFAYRENGCLSFVPKINKISAGRNQKYIEISED